MRLAGMPTPGESGRKTNLGRRFLTFDRQTQSLEDLRSGYDPLILDSHTLKDLEIFETDSDAESLFEFCNFTRTEGGAAAAQAHGATMVRSGSNQSDATVCCIHL